MALTGALVLIVDDDAAQAEQVAAALEAAGFRTLRAADAVEGLVAVEEQQPDVIVLDWELPFIDGSIFIRALRAGLERPPPVVVLAPPTLAAETILQLGAAACVPTPPEPQELRQAVHAALGGRSES